MRFNRLKSARSLRINTVLMIPIPTGSAKQIAQTLEREKKAAKREGLSHSSSDEVPAGTKLASSSTSDSASGKGPVKTEVIDGRTRITYGVQDGDTLWAIASGVARPGEDLRDVVREIEMLNGMPSAVLTAGQQILLPVAG